MYLIAERDTWRSRRRRHERRILTDWPVSHGPWKVNDPGHRCGRLVGKGDADDDVAAAADCQRNIAPIHQKHPSG